MKLNEIIDLIKIKNYAFSIVNSTSSSKENTKYMNNIIILIDKKINNLLASEAFKEYIDYDSIEDAIKEVRNNSNIKNGIK